MIPNVEFNLTDNETLELLSFIFPNDSSHSANIKAKEGRSIKLYLGFYPSINERVISWVLNRKGIRLGDSYRYFIAKEVSDSPWSSTHRIQFSNDVKTINRLY